MGAEGDGCAVGVLCGAAYVYRFNGTSWVEEQQKLTVSDAAAVDSFGSSVAVSGDTTVVGAYGDDCAAGDYCGSAYLFDLLNLKGPDCNCNGAADVCDIASGAPDNNSNGIPDECEYPDCNNNGIPDECDLACGETDGACDVPGCGENVDSDGDGVMDECDTCPGYDDAEPCPIPTVSEWGLIVMALLVLTAGTLVYARRRVTTA